MRDGKRPLPCTVHLSYETARFGSTSSFAKKTWMELICFSPESDVKGY